MNKKELINQLTGVGLLNQDISIPVKYVIELVAQLDDNEKSEQPVVKSFVTEENYRELSKDLSMDIVSEVTSNSDNLIEDYELDLNGREIDVRDITFHERRLREYIVNTIETWFEQKFEDQKNEQEVEEDIEG